MIYFSFSLIYLFVCALLKYIEHWASLNLKGTHWHLIMIKKLLVLEQREGCADSEPERFNITVWLITLVGRMVFMSDFWYLLHVRSCPHRTVQQLTPIKPLPWKKICMQCKYAFVSRSKRLIYYAVTHLKFCRVS